MLYTYGALHKTQGSQCRASTTLHNTQGSHCRASTTRRGRETGRPAELPEIQAHGSRVKTAERPDSLLSAQIKMIKPEHRRKATSKLPSAVKMILVNVAGISAENSSTNTRAEPAPTEKICSSQKLARIFLRLSPRDPQLEELSKL